MDVPTTSARTGATPSLSEPPAVAGPSPRISRFSLVRERVVDAIERELDNQLVIVRSARGAGTTEAIAQTLAAVRRRADRAVARISTGGADAATVWSRLLSALEANHTFPLPAGAQAGADSDVDVLAIRIGASRVVLAIDDVDAETADALATDLLMLLETCPGLCVIVSGRQRTRLEAPGIAVRCDLVVVPGEVLTFTTAETVSLLALAGIGATPDVAGELTRSLGAWPGAIRLAAAHLRFLGQTSIPATAIPPLARTVLDEYATDMTSGLSASVLRFATEAAVAPHLTPALIDDLPFTAGDRAAADLVPLLERAGLGSWTIAHGSARFTITPALRAPLIAAIERDAPDAADRLRRATADHLGRHGDALLAAEIAADAEDWDLVAGLLDEHAAACWLQSPARFDRVVSLLPDSVVEARPSLDTAITSLASESAFGPQILARLERLLVSMRAARSTLDDGEDSLALETRRVLLRRRTGQYGQAAAAADRLAEIADRHAARVRSESDRRAEALLQVGVSYLHAGRPKEGRWRLTEAARSAVGAHLRVAAVGLLALNDTLLGNVRDAAALLDTLAGDEEQAWFDSPWGVAACLASASVLIEEGSIAEAGDALDRVESRFPTSELWPVLGALRATHHLLGADAGTGLSALQDLDELNATTPAARPFDGHLAAARSDLLVALRQSRRAITLLRTASGVHEATAPALARALLFAGQDESAYLVAQQWSVRDQTSPRTTLQALLVRATTDLRMERSDAARDAIARAAAMTTATGMTLPWSTIPADDQEPIVALVPATLRGAISFLPLQFRENLTIPVLSTREQVVLSQLQSGAPIAQIARSLVVSPNTVKTQVRSVYRKLGVSTRGEAIRAAHEWRILRVDGAVSTALTGT